MNIDDLCNTETILKGNNFLDMMEETHSQFYANWVYELRNMDYERISISPEDIVHNQTYLYNSLPLKQAIRACRNMYTYELAKITIEISDPVVMTVQKRLSSTFSEQLGVVGKDLLLIWHGIPYRHDTFRRNYWAVHWNEHNKHDRGILLDNEGR